MARVAGVALKSSAIRPKDSVEPTRADTLCSPAASTLVLLLIGLKPDRVSSSSEEGS